FRFRKPRIPRTSIRLHSSSSPNSSSTPVVTRTLPLMLTATPTPASPWSVLKAAKTLLSALKFMLVLPFTRARTLSCTPGIFLETAEVLLATATHGNTPFYGSGGDDATIEAVSAEVDDGEYFTIEDPTEDMVDDETSVKFKYEEDAFSHYVNVTTEAGEFQDLVVWEDMPKAARTALNLNDFGEATVPFNEENFLDNLEGAYPF
ncbi:hypothetical protein L914_14508, partial [Phytophthora nicotianae]